MRYGIIRRVVDGSGGGFSRLGSCGEGFLLPIPPDTPQLRQCEHHQQRVNRSAALRESTKYPHSDRTLGDHMCVYTGRIQIRVRPEPDTERVELTRRGPLKLDRQLMPNHRADPRNPAPCLPKRVLRARP